MLSSVPTASVVVTLVILVCTVIGYTAKRIVSTERIQTYFAGRKRPKFVEVEHKNMAEKNQPASAETQGSLPTVQVVELKKSELDYDPTVLRETLLETST